MISRKHQIDKDLSVILKNRFACLAETNLASITIFESNQISLPGIETSDLAPTDNISVPVYTCTPEEESIMLLNETEPDQEKCSVENISKGLHFCNLNIRHILPKLDELKILMASEHSPDVLVLCETFLTASVSDNQIHTDGFDVLPKDRSNIEEKSGGGVLLYTRKSLTCKRRSELESNPIETIWAEIALPNSKPFLICSVYRPPNSHVGWIDTFEEELSKAQTTGLEIILMGDFNIDFGSCTNHKWRNLIQLFDLSQLVQEPTHVTETSSTLIDHIYSSNPENIIECFVPFYSISDHFPVCITRKINGKIPKAKHISKSYRCFKHFDENAFLSDLSVDMNSFTVEHPDINQDMQKWYSIISKHLDKHAPIRHKQVKTNRLPEWLNEEITIAQRQRDNAKRLKKWREYKKYRNKVTSLIRKAKRHHFSESIPSSKDTKTIWKHLKSASKPGESTNILPEEITVNNEKFSSSEQVATKLNEFFTSISELLINSNTEDSTPDLNDLINFIQSKVPHDVHFKIPRITTSQVTAYKST